MLQACIDDSGWDGTSPVFVLAGYVAKAEAWDAFADEWRALLDKASVKVLKTTDILPKQGSWDALPWND